jgi:hypothetical protein
VDGRGTYWNVQKTIEKPGAETQHQPYHPK